MKRLSTIPFVLVLVSLLLTQCATPTPQTIEKIVTQEVVKVVTQEVEKVVTVEVIKSVEITPTAQVLSQEDIDKLWKQYEGQGLSINFLSEDTPSTAAIVNYL